MTGKKKEKKRECEYALYSYTCYLPDFSLDERPCSRPTLPGDEYCIFHSEKIEGKKKGKFDEEFLQEFGEFKTHREMEGAYDFSGFVFPGDFSLFANKKFKKNVSFAGAKLFGSVSFGHFMGAADFGGAEFFGDAGFYGTTFVGNANFERAIFSKESNINFNRAKFYGDADFKDAKFYGNADFKDAKFFGNADFKDAKFSKIANFGFAEFSGNTEYSEIKEPKIVHRGNATSSSYIRADPECVQTSCKADFNGAEFSGQANFTSATFHGCAEFKIVCYSEVNFHQVHFCNISKFSYAKFKGEAIFQDAVFRKSTSFFRAEFSKYTSFRGAKLRGESNFENAKFYGETVFEYAEFCNPPEHAESSKSSKTTSFQMAVFYDKALFNEAKFFGETYFTQAVFKEVASFRKTEFHKLSIFGYAKFNEDADFTGVIIENINSFNMQYTYFFNVIGLIEYIEENDKVFKKRRKRSKTLKTEFLPKNFKLILGEAAAARYPVFNRQIKDDIYLLDKEERISKIQGIKKFKDKTLYFLWWLFADYGRRFGWWALWCFGIASLFGAVFANYSAPDWLPFKDFFCSINPEFQISPDCRIPTEFTPYYFSVVTFTTLGFGDVTPLNLAGEIWLTAEVILGYIMLGGLISILANKLARRS